MPASVKYRSDRFASAKSDYDCDFDEILCHRKFKSRRRRRASASQRETLPFESPELCAHLISTPADDGPKMRARQKVSDLLRKRGNTFLITKRGETISFFVLSLDAARATKRGITVI